MTRAFFYMKPTQLSVVVVFCYPCTNYYNGYETVLCLGAKGRVISAGLVFPIPIERFRWIGREIPIAREFSGLGAPGELGLFCCRLRHCSRF